MLRPVSVFAGLLACNLSAPSPKTEADAPKADLLKADAPKADAPKADAPKTDAPKTGCAAEVAAMRELFAFAPASATAITLRPGMQLAETSVGTEIEAGFPIFLLADGTFNFDTRPLATAAALKEMLAEEFDRSGQLARAMGEPFAPRLLLIADARAPVSAIRDLVDAVPPETTWALLATRAGDIVPIPPPVPAVQEVLALPVDVRSPKIAQLVSAAIGPCAPLADVFGDVAHATAGMRARVLLDGLPGALEACRCEGVDVKTLVAAVWGTNGKFEPEQRQLALPLTADRKAEAPQLPAAAAVADLVRLVEARGAKPLRLALQP